MAREVLVPFNLARLGDRVVGIDAFFWPFLEKRFRTVLLVHPISYVEGVRGNGCRLEPRVSISEQLGELEEIAGRKPARPKTPKISLGARLAWLFLPFSMIKHMFEEEAKGLEITEEMQAVGLAKELKKLEPVGGISYAVFKFTEDDLLLPVQENMRRIYSELAKRDPGYREACKAAKMICKP
ncbi:hypothetical protein PYJP_06900 [Pyrofollis japonicus]|uniref:hypothetical protein n=1 Tax=Pyrofollis japonicus TaxID=3060460 RepID=UPI00295AC4E8|nr:hypothetical protein [Pyrofollis japonicus]BEP17338.1 hypothetical protein PYJP_06900 [Pyrofollis japonicus]